MTALIKQTLLQIIVPSQYVAQSEAIFARMQSAGSLPTAGRRTLIDTTVRKLIEAGIWPLGKALWVLRAETAIQASVNWITPSASLLVPVNSPVFTANSGYTGDGVSAYITTGFTPSSSSQQAISGELVAGSNSAGGEISTNDTSSIFTLTLRNTAGTIFGTVQRTNGPTYSLPGSINPYIATVSRGATAARTLYLNGAIVGTNSTGTDTTAIAALNFLGQPARSSYSVNTLGMAFITDTVTDTQAAAINTIFTDYRNGV